MPRPWRFVALAAAFAFGGAVPVRAAAPLRAYIGTATPEPGRPVSPSGDAHGQGIYVVEADPANGHLSPPRLVATTPSPIWMVMDAAGNFLYAVNGTGTYNGAHSGSVTAYAIDRQSGNLKLINSVSSQDAVPAYASMDPTGKFLLVANYSGSSIAVLPILPGGGLGEATDLEHLTGPVHPDRAADNPAGQFAFSDHGASHPHMIQPDPSGRFVIVDDAGLDQIALWRLDRARGRLSPQAMPVAAPPGSAPRHFVFDASGRRFYQLFEQDSKLAWYDFEPGSGKLTLRQTLSTLPDGFAGSNLASEILLFRDHLYVANRLFDTIAVFALDATGRMTPIQQEPTRGDYPRSLTVDPTGHFLYSLNQRGDSVTAFGIDAKSGKLEFTDSYVPVGSPTVMLFQR